MKNAFRAYRRNQPHHNEVEQTATPFFDKTNDAPGSPFFSKGNGVVQTKLTVGQPGDVYEQEADAVADEVVQNQHNNAAPAIQQKGISRIQRVLTAAGAGAGTAEERMKEDQLVQEKREPGIQKMEMPKEEEDPLAAGAVQKMEMPKEEEDPLAAGAVQKMEMPKEEEDPLAAGAVQKMEMPKEEEEKPGSAPAVMTKPDGTQTAPPQISHGIESSKGSGSALPDATRAEMESSIGCDFSGVNIHTGQEAADLNKDLHAQAFTHGQDVYFNEGKYNPQTTEGKRLLAHELTHVVQQGGAGKEGLNMKSIHSQNPGSINTIGENRIQRDIKGSGSVAYGDFTIDMTKKEIPPDSKAGEDGTIKFKPNEKSPNTNEIGLIQIVRTIDLTKATPEEYKWTGGEADRNNMMTSDSTDKYTTSEKDTLKKIAESQTKGHITPLEIYDLNKVKLGGFDENKEIAKGIELSIPKTQKGYFVDHLAADTYATPRASTSDKEVPPYYNMPKSSTATMHDGYKKSKTDIKDASLYDFPGGGTSFKLEFHFETVASSADKGFNYGTLHWGFKLLSGKISDEYYHVEAGTSSTFESALAEFNEFYKNHHIVVRGETLNELAKLYYGDSSKWTDIQKANGLKDTTIIAGQKLIIPKITKE